MTEASIPTSSPETPAGRTHGPSGAINRRGPMREGERIQIMDDRGKLTTITLTAGQEYQTHKGVLPHDLLIGQPEGTVVENSVGIAYQALRPLMKDFVLSMPRGAAVVYPKDAGQIVTMADISRAPGWSRPAWAPVRCRSRCCARSATRAACTPSSAARSSRRSPRATSRRSSAGRTLLGG